MKPITEFIIIIITCGMLVLAAFIAFLIRAELPETIKLTWLATNGITIIFCLTVTALGGAMLWTPQEPNSKMARQGRIIFIAGLVVTALAIISAIPGASME